MVRLKVDFSKTKLFISSPISIPYGAIKRGEYPPIPDINDPEFQFLMVRLKVIQNF